MGKKTKKEPTKKVPIKFELGETWIEDSSHLQSWAVNYMCRELTDVEIGAWVTTCVLLWEREQAAGRR